MNEQNLKMRRWPKCMRSTPTRVAKRLCFNMDTWFGCTYARIDSQTNARTSCNHMLMDHSKIFARSMTIHMKLIFQVHMVLAQVSTSPTILHFDDSFSRGWGWCGHPKSYTSGWRQHTNKYKPRTNYMKSCQETTTRGELSPSWN
jgi:hypothetical protein